jgi:HEAT repeat protein
MRLLLVTSLALFAVGCGRSTDEWLEQLKNPDVVKRRQAIRELGSRSGDAERVVAALTESLQDESGYVRHDAATTLGKFGPAAKPAASNLTKLLKDKELSVRKAAEAALQKIAHEAMVEREVLRKSTERDNKKVNKKGAIRE